MRKLLVVLVVLLAVGTFADWSTSGTVTVKVGQWLDITLSTQGFNITKYGEDQEFFVGTVFLDSNANVTFSSINSVIPQEISSYLSFVTDF